jgi:hypothetical protein
MAGVITLAMAFLRDDEEAQRNVVSPNNSSFSVPTGKS